MPFSRLRETSPARPGRGGRLPGAVLLTVGLAIVAACTTGGSGQEQTPTSDDPAPAGSPAGGPDPIVAPATTVAAPASPAPSLPPDAVPFEVAVRGQVVRGVDLPGPGPAVVLMHGFPDDSHIYDHLLGRISPSRRVVAFDFLGYGGSDRTSSPATRPTELDQLDAVIATLHLEQLTLVGHDASGPVAIDYTLDHPDRVERLVLLNTYYGNARQLRFPEMIRLFAEPELAPLADAMVGDPAQRLWLLQHTARQFGYDPLSPNGVGVTSVVAQFFGDARNEDALAAIRSWTGRLLPDLAAQDRRIAAGDLGRLTVPVTIAFGRGDPYLSTPLAEHLAGLFAHAELRPVGDASHWPQWDQPDVVAGLLTDGGR
jgi:pimeloyl-ACP methyl ester carboxylesterase